jgi:hypothetical protein
VSVLGSGTICSGDSAAIQADLGGDPPWTVWWSDGAISNNVNTTPLVRSVNPANPYPNISTNYSYWITNLSNLTSTNSLTTNDTGVAVVTVDPTPTTAPTNPGDVISCFDVAAALSVGVPSGFSANWYADPTGTNLLAILATNYVPPVPVAGTKPVTNTYYAATVFNDPNVNCQFASLTPVKLISLNCTNQLTLTTGPTNVVIQWYGNYVLQHATNLSAPIDWITITQFNQVANHFWTNSTAPPPENNFFRLYAPTNVP